MANEYSPDTFGRQSTEVRSIFGDLEIVESKTDFVVYVTADEHQKGVRGDPNNCMFSQACKRALGSHGVLFYPTVAYVDMIDPRPGRSGRIVMRFGLPAYTRKALEDFDAEVGGFKEASFLLKAIRPSERLAAKAKRSRARRLTPAERDAARSAAVRRGTRRGATRRCWASAPAQARSTRGPPSEYPGRGMRAWPRWLGSAVNGGRPPRPAAMPPPHFCRNERPAATVPSDPAGYSPTQEKRAATPLQRPTRDTRDRSSRARHRIRDKRRRGCRPGRAALPPPRRHAHPLAGKAVRRRLGVWATAPS